MSFPSYCPPLTSSHESTVFFLSLPSFTSLFPVKSEILHRIQGSAVPVPSKQAQGLPRNSPESKAGGELDDSRQVKAISDEQRGSQDGELQH